jgi:hypothetical protein
MKNFRQFCSAVVLTLLFTFSAFAGDIQGPGITAQPPPTPQTASTGEMDGPHLVTLDPLTEITLKMLESMLSIF